MLKIAVARCAGYRVDAVLGTRRRARRDHIPREVMTAQTAMFLQLLRGAGQRLPVHDRMEGEPQFGPRLQRPERAFLGSDPVRVRLGRLRLTLLGERGAVFRLDRLELA